MGVVSMSHSAAHVLTYKSGFWILLIRSMAPFTIRQIVSYFDVTRQWSKQAFSLVTFGLHSKNLPFPVPSHVPGSTLIYDPAPPGKP